MSKTLDTLHAKLYCGIVNKGGSFLDFLLLTTAYLSKKLDSGWDIETSVGPVEVLTNLQVLGII